jgi:hypothetical protein
MVSNAAVDAQVGQCAKVAEELSDGVPARVELREQCIGLPTLSRVAERTVEHVPEDRDDNLRHFSRGVVIHDRKDRLLKPPQPAQENVEVVAAEPEGLLRLHDRTDMRVREQAHRRLRR